MQVRKRTGKIVEFDYGKIEAAVKAAFSSCGYEVPEYILNNVQEDFYGYSDSDILDVEEIQNSIETTLMLNAPTNVAKAFILYREQHKQARFIKERIDYMNSYSDTSKNAASASETDANANVTMKNVANLEGEVYKSTNRIIQRSRMKAKLQEMFPEVADKYEEDLKNHIIYVHDEASSPALKPYCMAVTLYPLMTDGTGPIDGVTPYAPNDIQSFSGQVTNLVFLLSSQCKGAVALGDYQIALNYYVVKEFGEKWYEHLDDVITTSVCCDKRTVKDAIRKGMKSFIYGVNQPAGNRSYNSPFSNISYYDSVYYEAMFGEFTYPDGTKPEWKAIDTLQRIFMELHRELRLIKPLTFPVTTMAMVHDGNDYLDQEYKQLCADEWARGGSFFLYSSDNPTSLASCCRVLNEVSNNTFSSTIGMTGVMTGSCNVITLNINRIVQDCVHSEGYAQFPKGHRESVSMAGLFPAKLKKYLSEILERVYKYHIAYKSMLYDMEDAGMYSCSNANYIYLKKLYSTIGLIGYCEAAEYIGLEVGVDTPLNKYKDFLRLIFGTVKESNREHSIRDKKRPFLFNSEAIPGESLAVKFYNWDRQDDYYVPEDQNLYSSYFFKQWDNRLNVFNKMDLHGEYINSSCDGGQACHLHLDSHLTKAQYLKLMDYGVKKRVNYYTFNIPMSECKDCGHVVNAPVTECPICNSKHIDYWVRIIGYLRPVSAFSKDRQLEASKRIYSHVD